jgi:hypothetical protein
MAQCRGFRPGCTNEATHTAKGYRLCLECARQFAGYTPEPIDAPLLERLAALLTAARAYRDAWAGCSLPMGPLACGAYWERLEAAIAALDEREG